MEIKINEELIKRVATVSRLNLTQEEIIKFTEDFKSILNAFDKVNDPNPALGKAGLVDKPIILRKKEPKAPAIAPTTKATIIVKANCP